MKQKIVRISFEIFKQLLSADHHSRSFRVIGQGIPADAELVGVKAGTDISLHGAAGLVDIVIRSESFPVTPEGQTIPFLIPVCQVVAE